MISLKNKKNINKLFTDGEKTIKFPLMVLTLDSDFKGFLVTVSTKKFKRAVDRNKVKRIIRESLKDITTDKSVGIVYLDNKLPDLNKVKKIIDSFVL